MVMPSFIIRTNFSLEKGELRSAPLRPRVRSEDERFEVHRGWQRRPGAGEHRRGGGIALWCLDCSRRKLDLMIQTQAAIACEIIKEKLSMVNDMANTSDEIMLVKRAQEDCEKRGAASTTGFASSGVGASSTATKRLFQLRASLQDPQQVPEGLAEFFNDPKCKRWLFEAKRLVNPRVIDVGAGLRIGAGQEGC